MTRLNESWWTGRGTAKGNTLKHRPLGMSLVALTTAALLGTGTAVAVADPAATVGSPVKAAVPAATAGQPVERLIVGYTSQAAEAKSDSAATEDAKNKGRRTGESLDFDRRLGTGAVLVDLGAELGKKDAADVMAAFRADPDVAFVVPDKRMYATAVTPNDAEYNRQWDLFEATAGMNVPDAWGKATGAGVKVAVIDTGYVSHSDLTANVVAGYDFTRRQRRLRRGHPERHQRRREPWRVGRRRGRQQQRRRGRLQPGQLLQRHHGRRLRP